MAGLRLIRRIGGIKLTPEVYGTGNLPAGVTAENNLVSGNTIVNVARNAADVDAVATTRSQRYAAIGLIGNADK